MIRLTLNSELQDAALLIIFLQAVEICKVRGARGEFGSEEEFISCIISEFESLTLGPRK